MLLWLFSVLSFLYASFDWPLVVGARVIWIFMGTSDHGPHGHTLLQVCELAEVRHLVARVRL